MSIICGWPLVCIFAGFERTTAQYAQAKMLLQQSWQGMLHHNAQRNVPRHSYAGRAMICRKFTGSLPLYSDLIIASGGAI
jgi:hypothetical protein